MLKTVFITEESPYPAKTGGKLRDQNMIMLLRELSEVRVICFSGKTKGQPEWVSFIHRDRAPFWRRAISTLKPSVINGYSKNLESELKKLYEPGALLFASRLTMGKYFRCAKSLGYLTILDEHNVESDLLIAGARKNPHKLLQLKNAYAMAKIEAFFCAEADQVIAVSERDRDLIKKLAPLSNVTVIPNTIDCDLYPESALSESESFVFTGTLSYYPNAEGLNWFIDHAWPLLREKSPHAKITVAGSSPSNELRHKVRSAGFELLENPVDMAPIIQGASVIFVPLLSGGGTRIKIIEAMASGKAIVSTRKGAEGLGLTHLEEIYFADDPAEFAGAMNQLQENSQLRKKIGKKAALFARQKYDWRVMRPAIRQVLESLAKK